MWLVTGVSGQLGSVLLKQLIDARLPAFGVASPRGPLPSFGDTERVELTDDGALEAIVARLRPRFIVHAAAVAAVATAHADPDRARRVNVDATSVLCRAGARSGARVVYVSTDMVFDGENAPYDEDATPSPLSDYGRSKLLGERAALAEGALVARLPLMYGLPAVERNTTFVEQVKLLRQRKPLRLFHDEFRSPLWLEDAASSLVRVAQSDLSGRLHVGGPERLSRLEMGELLVGALGVPRPDIESVGRNDVASSEPRARDLSLSSKRYAEAFGVAPGRTMREALEAVRDALRWSDVQSLGTP
ncbi:MAG TPA: SDR family oxidoreductase [Polyangiaceae bacterium]|nr:SDR family oxidoreductase [Polyangiaceae bacterium]